MIFLSEDLHVDPNTVNGRELHSMAATARLLGCRVISIPAAADDDGSAENAFTYVPSYEPAAPAIWIGYIPTVSRYITIYNAAASRGVRLVNSPDEYQCAMEFDLFYPKLRELTPESIIVTSEEDALSAGSRLGFPVFVKGAVKSNKERGWKACVAENNEELAAITTDLFSRDQRSRGRVILRRIAPLRVVQIDSQSFPLGREYRVFVLNNRVLALGFYWEGLVDSQPLTRTEESAINALAREAAKRVGTPYIAVDVGQLVNGEWIVIEVGDGQFCGLSQVPILELWNKLIAEPNSSRC